MTIPKSTTFSIDTDLSVLKLKELTEKLGEIDERMGNIFDQAVVGGYPVAKMIYTQFSPSASDLKMLSKVFARLAELHVEREALAEKVTALTAISKNADWIYDSIGSPERDIDLWLNTFSSEVPVTDTSVSEESDS